MQPTKKDSKPEEPLTQTRIEDLPLDHESGEDIKGGPMSIAFTKIVYRPAGP